MRSGKVGQPNHYHGKPTSLRRSVETCKVILLQFSWEVSKVVLLRGFL